MLGLVVRVRVVSMRRYPMCAGTFFVSILATLVMLFSVVSLVRQVLRVVWQDVVRRGLVLRCVATLVTSLLVLSAE